MKTASSYVYVDGFEIFNYLTIPFTRKNDTTIDVFIRILELFCLHSFELKYVNA